jgi:hypothetical protein
MKFRMARIAFPFLRAFDAGSGGGPASGTVPIGGERITSGGPGGGSSGAAGAGSAGGGSSQPIRLSDDALVDLGDGKPVKFSDWKSGFVPKADHDSLTQRYSQGRDYLLGEAKKLEQGWQTLAGLLRQQGHGAAGSGQANDPLAKFRQMALVDGPALADAYEAMRTGDLQPMRDQLGKQQQLIAQLTQQVQGLRGGMGAIGERDSESSYQRQLDSTIQGLNLPGLNANDPEIKPHLPLLRDVVDDIYRSHDPNDPNYGREMPGIVRGRLEGLLKLATSIAKVKVAAAKSDKRRFLRPGGDAAPGQPRGYQHENGRQLARRFFDSLDSQAS